jgi:hypothetical protein
MKNTTIKTFTVVAVTVFLLNHCAIAQSIAFGPYENDEPVMLTHSNVNNGDEKKSSDVSGSIHPRATENFQKAFKGITGERWVTNNEGYFASFIKDSVYTRVDYNKNGRWLETIRYYNEKKLPGEVHYMIKKGYSDYSILGVAEVSFDDDPVYMVYIQDGIYIKMIGVYQAEMTEIESHKRL